MTLPAASPALLGPSNQLPSGILWNDRELARIWRPRTFLQRATLECTANLMLQGACAGSYKTENLIINAIRYRQRPLASSILFRKTCPELEQMIERAASIYKRLGALYNGDSRVFRFPSGAKVKFDFMEQDKHEDRQYSNQYDFVGFDESTKMNKAMRRIRFMFSRLRSPDPYLQRHLRMHLGTNPGGAGNNDHKHVFIGPRCCHCAIHRGTTKDLPAGTRIPGKVYTDATWPGGDPVTPPDFFAKFGFKLSTVFIPGILDEANLLSATYRANLSALTVFMQKALLAGCWDITEGQYFDIWNEKQMVVRRQDIMDQWWWPHWVGLDYGFSGSSTCAYLFTLSPEGVIYVITELVFKHELASDVAIKCKAAWEVNNRTIQAWYVSPDLWNKTGDGHQRSDQMMQAARINLTQASTDRAGGAMLCYQLLRDIQMRIADTCKTLILAVPSRIHNDEEGEDPDDVKKIISELEDDAYDAWRMGVYSYIGPGDKPRALKLQEAVTSTDPTAAMIQYRMAEEKIAKEEQPIFVRGRRRRGQE